MKFTKIPALAFSNMQFNAGMLLSDFDPDTGHYNEGDIIGATSGGISASAVPSYSDMGDGVDNCPLNVMELKRIDSYECTISGTLVTIDYGRVAMLMGAYENPDPGSSGGVRPTKTLKAGSFDDIWWVGDYSDKNDDTNGGFIAICLRNALNTSGFSVQSNDKGKGTFSFTFVGHISIDDADKVPFEVYVKPGGTT